MSTSLMTKRCCTLLRPAMMLLETRTKSSQVLEDAPGSLGDTPREETRVMLLGVMLEETGQWGGGPGGMLLGTRTESSQVLEHALPEGNARNGASEGACQKWKPGIRMP